MFNRLRRLWKKWTTTQCDSCDEPVPVKAFRPTGNTRQGTLFSGSQVELECPHCGYTFWVRK
jgi:RNase P subunit RPR2